MTHWNNLYKVENNILLTNWIHQINLKKRCFKWDKLIKGSKHQRKEGFDIKTIISKVKYQVCYAQIIGIANQRENIKVDQEIRVFSDCKLKLHSMLFVSFLSLKNLISKKQLGN